MDKMEVLSNYNLLGNILTFLSPLEHLSSIQLVNRIFNHTSKTYWAIEKAYVDMISDLFGIQGPKIENQGIKIITGLFNKMSYSRRVIFKLKRCTACGRFLEIGSPTFGRRSKPATQGTPNGPINHRVPENIKLLAHGESFVVMIGHVERHKCQNMNFENNDSPDIFNNEWLGIMRKKVYHIIIGKSL